MTIIDEARDIQRWSEQTKAVAHHLEKYGSLTKHEAVRIGIEGYGIIEHPGARIFDLREMGWMIETKTRPTEWKLVSKPVPKQLPLI